MPKAHLPIPSQTFFARGNRISRAKAQISSNKINKTPASRYKCGSRNSRTNIYIHLLQSSNSMGWLSRARRTISSQNTQTRHAFCSESITNLHHIATILASHDPNPRHLARLVRRAALNTQLKHANGLPVSPRRGFHCFVDVSQIQAHAQPAEPSFWRRRTRANTLVYTFSPHTNGPLA